MRHRGIHAGLVHLFCLALAAAGTACSGDPAPCTGAGCAGPAVRNVRLSHLGVKYDVTKPLFLNNRLPISFGVTAESADSQHPVTQNVAVGFAFVEADPLDPANPSSCASSAIDVELTADGKEQLVDAFIWPTSDCGALAGKRVNLEVSFDGGDELKGEVASAVEAATVLFSAAHQGDAANQQCRSALDPAASNPGRGCVYELQLEPTPSGADGKLIDVRYELTSTSSVAVLPFRPTMDIGPGGPPDLEPSLVVRSGFVVNGRDPYVSPMTADETIPADLLAADPELATGLKFGLDDAALAALRTLPGSAKLSYTLRTAADPATRLPLTIGSNGPDASVHLTEALVTEVVPGTSRFVAHELFIEGATETAVAAGGAWADETDFVVTGCFDASFPQSGNEGEGADAVADCREVPVKLVRETASSSAAMSLSFNKGFGRELGSSRIGVASSMSTSNRLDRSGASSENEGSVVLKGDLGKRFELTIARAFATAKLDVDPEKNGYDVGVEAFNQTVYSASKSGPRIVATDDFSTAKSFKLGGLGFGFGPVRVGFEISVGGRVGIETEDTLEVLGDDQACTALLAATETVTSCGRMSRAVTPNFALTGQLFGGIDLRLVKAGVEANLSFVHTRFPLAATLGFGVTDTNHFLVRANARWDMTLSLIEGDVAIVGSVGFRRWRKHLRVPLFSFSSPEKTFNLMNVSMPDFDVLD